MGGLPIATADFAFRFFGQGVQDARCCRPQNNSMMRSGLPSVEPEGFSVQSAYKHACVTGGCQERPPCACYRFLSFSCIRTGLNSSTVLVTPLARPILQKEVGAGLDAFNRKLALRLIATNDHGGFKL